MSKNKIPEEKIKEIKYVNGEKIIILKAEETEYKPRKRRSAKKHYRRLQRFK